MNVAMVTVRAMTHGLARGRHVSWNVSVAAAAKACSCLVYMDQDSGKCF